MALTNLQRAICQLIAQNRIDSGESYVAGGVALNEALAAPRVSRDIDLFHDTNDALDATWAADRALLEQAGFQFEVIREVRGFVQALVRGLGDSVKMEWVRDSAYRFFPLRLDATLGVTLHPFDLATNKVLALVGRLEVRDWVDAIEIHDRIQPIGYLAWAACGKDPGFSPSSILEFAARSHYSSDEVSQLAFAGPAPSAHELSSRWRAMIEEARTIVGTLPALHAGKAVLASSGELFRDQPDRLRESLSAGHVRFHEGCIRGALPTVLPG
ncbi:MAG: hypothetical protein JJE39_02025 [Vicinamibacteria bacterium]|nr:hypothetical protein [Vicinamibacteria bacterium]